jgi:hypothetical protein
LSTATHPNQRPTPAIVSQEAVRRLPRWALPLLGVVYVLAGFLGRDPWKAADVASYGLMEELAAGRTDWLDPRLLGQMTDLGGLLPYWLGAWAIQIAAWLSPLGLDIAPEVAARVPFGALLAVALVATWYGVYYLARLPAAQPVPFAFGGEADPVDYARAMADGGLLALVAMLGLAQLSHETTPTLAQLAFSALLFYALAASLFRPAAPAVALVVASLGLSLSGAPAFGLAMMLAGALVRARHGDERALRWSAAFAVAGLVAAALALWLDLWRAGIGLWPMSLDEWRPLGRLWVWFTWPAWPLALVALWKWRRHLASTHMAWPTAVMVVMLVATIIRPGADRTLLLAAPALACLAAMALPTIHRSVSALIDWFTLLFFSGCALLLWLMYVAMHTGMPAKPAANLRRLVPGFEPEFSWLALLIAAVTTLVWIAIIVWRSGRHRAALWKSLVLPASGMVMCWVLLTSLMMPPLNYARSYAPMIARLVQAMPASARTGCVYANSLTNAQLAALMTHSQLDVMASPETISDIRCNWLVADRDRSRASALAADGWKLHQSLRRRSNDNETLLLYRRAS